MGQMQPQGNVLGGLMTPQPTPEQQRAYLSFLTQQLGLGMQAAGTGSFPVSPPLDLPRVLDLISHMSLDELDELEAFLTELSESLSVGIIPTPPTISKRWTISSLFGIDPV